MGINDVNAYDFDGAFDCSFEYEFFGDLWENPYIDLAMTNLSVISEKLSISLKILVNIESEINKIDVNTEPRPVPRIPGIHQARLTSAFRFENNPDFILLRYDRGYIANVFVGYFHSSGKYYILTDFYGESLVDLLNNMITQNRDNFKMHPVCLAFMFIAINQTEGSICVLESEDDFPIALVGLKGLLLKVNYENKNYKKSKFALYFTDVSKDSHILDNYRYLSDKTIYKNINVVIDSISVRRDEYVNEYGTNVNSLDNKDVKIQTTWFNPFNLELARYEILIDSNCIIKRLKTIIGPLSYKHLLSGY